MKSYQAVSMGWSQPAENTHASLVEAMQRMDGVEFDLRLTADDQLVVHHDHTVSISAENVDTESGEMDPGSKELISDLALL